MYSYKYTTNLLNSALIVDKLGLSSGEHLADFGCGRSGAFTFLAARTVGKHGLVYAVDIIKDHLVLIDREAKEYNLANIKTIWADLEKSQSTRLSSNSLDVVLIINTLHQIKDHENTIQEAYRILKKDGRLLIIDWTRAASPLSPDQKIEKQSLLDYCTETGLSLHQQFMAGKHHYALIFIK